MIALFVHPRNSNHLRSHLWAIIALDHGRLDLENELLENKSGLIFLRSTSLLNKILPTNLGECKPTFHTFYTSHLGWNSNIRRCFDHTDLRQNAVFHKFSRKIALIQYSEPSKHAWAFSKTVQKISKIIFGQPVLTFDKHQIFSERLKSYAST